MIADTLVDAYFGGRMPVRMRNVELIETASDIWMRKKGI